jgi:ligand-binding sensor domain-containing protein/signal transduction histidine kinase
MNECRALRFYFLILFALIVQHTLGQNAQREMRFEHFSLEQGLSQSSALSVLQDRQGYLWIGTTDGLNCYDGYRFTVYRHDTKDATTISGYAIYSLFEDHEGSLWVGTEGGGLNKLDPSTKTFEHFTNDPNNPSSISSNFVRAIYQDRSGSLWIGTSGGLNKFDPKTKSFEHFANDPQNQYSLNNNSIRVIYEDSSGSLWIGTQGGLNKLNPMTKTFEHFTNDPKNPHSLNSNYVLSIYQDRSGSLWIGTSHGVNKFNPSTKTFEFFINNTEKQLSHSENQLSLNSNSVLSIYQDRSGALWIGTYGGGLNKFDPTTKSVEHFSNDPKNPNSLSSNNIYSIFQDRSESLWVGTYDGGLNKFDLITKSFDHITNAPKNPNGLSSNSVYAIYQDRSGSLWVGTFDGGLNKFDLATKSFDHFTNDPQNLHSLSNNGVFSIYQDRSGFLWVGTYDGGLNKFDPANKSFEHFTNDPKNPNSLSNNTVVSIFQDRSGFLWIGTYGGGLNKFNPTTKTFEHFIHDSKISHSLSNNTVLSIFQDRAGSLWVGTEGGGLDKFDPKTKIFEHFTHSESAGSLSNNSVYSIYQDRSGSLWVGTYGGGLNKFDYTTKSFTSYTMVDGLPNDCVYGVLEDSNGNLWLSTNKGLCKFNPRALTFRNYDVTDGLQSNEFNVGAYHVGQDGKFYFGGINGFNSFFPDSIKDNPYLPPMAITDFKIFDKSANYGLTPHDIVLSYDQNFFSFEFSALNFILPEKNQYAYQMEGFDKDWIYSGTRRYASYTNLDPGTYTFRVKGSNNDGVWNEQGISIKVVINPPWWLTWWFRGALVVGLATAAIGVYLLRTRQIRQTNRRLKAMVEERTMELQEKNEEIAAQNEELVQSEEEISAQREQLAAQNENLESEVARRTLELTVQNQQLEQFAFIASHNLRGPVARMLGLGKLVGAGAVADHEKGYVMDSLLESTKELDKVVCDLAHILDIRNTPQQITTTDLSKELALAEHTLATEITEAGVVVIADFTHLERVDTVRPYIQSIFLNLLDNAIKYRDPDRPLVVRVTAQVEGKFVRIRFADNGLGIDMERDGGKLFTLYARFHFHVKGKGMGLFLVKTQLEAMGGRIEAESTLGKGTTFNLYFKGKEK